MKKSPRRRLLIDASLQGALVCRAGLYWFLCLAVMLTLVVLQIAWTGGRADWPVLVSRTLISFGPALIASVLLLPLVLFDALRFSNRFAGPVFRLTREARRVADGHPPQPVRFRDADYWNDLATEFNRICDELYGLRGERTRSGPERESDPSLPPARPELAKDYSGS